MNIILPKIETVEEVVATVKQDIVKKTGFELTDAICPITGFALYPGFQRAVYFDDECGEVPMIIISQTRSLLFNLFTEIIEKLLSVKKINRRDINAIFESRHNPDSNGAGKRYDCSGRSPYYRDFMVREIDPITFLSMLYDFEELFMNDGFSGVSFLADALFSELRLDVHKEILFFCKNLKGIEFISSFLLNAGLPRLPPRTKTLAEQPHIHIGDSTYDDKFEQLVAVSGAKQVA